MIVITRSEMLVGPHPTVIQIVYLEATTKAVSESNQPIGQFIFKEKPYPLDLHDSLNLYYV
jgi:hypothetical protein